MRDKKDITNRVDKVHVNVFMNICMISFLSDYLLLLALYNNIYVNYVDEYLINVVVL